MTGANGVQHCFSAPAITGTLAARQARRIRPDEQQRPGRGHPRHRGRHGRRPRRHLPGLQGCQQPRARPDDVQPDAPGRRRRRVRQLGPVRGARASQAHAHREHLARAPGRRRLVALRRIGRQRLGRLQVRLPRVQVPGDRRPVEPAVRDGRGRHEPQDVRRARDRLVRFRRRRLLQLAAARIPGHRDLEPEREHPRGVLRRRHAQVPRDARCRNGRGSRRTATSSSATASAGAAAAGRSSAGRARPRRSWRGSRPTRTSPSAARATWASRTRSSTTRNGTGLGPGAFTDIKSGQQQRHRLALAGHQRLRHGDRAAARSTARRSRWRSPGIRRR